MYSIYIKNFMRYNSSGTATFVKSRELVYSIPITNLDNAFIDPVVKTEIGKAGSFEFTVLPTHPYYRAWKQFKTLLYVEYDGTTIFRGRVLTISNTLSGSKKIHCEGDLAFLLDSFQPMTNEESRSSITLNAYVKNLLAVHNAQMYQEDPLNMSSDAGIGSAVSAGGNGSVGSGVVNSYEYEDKIFTVGEIPGQYSGGTESAQQIANPSKKFGSKSWETTMSAFESLVNEYGGYLRTRYAMGSHSGVQHDICYLDWFENYFRNTPNNLESIEIGKNLIDLGSSTEVDNLFTILIPVGSKDGKDIYLSGYQYKSGTVWNSRYIKVSDLDRLCSEGVIPLSKLTVGYHTRADYRDSISNYGIIYKSQKFENADTQAKLWEYAIDWIANNYIGGVVNFTISALDLHHYNPSIYTSKYLCGDRIRLIYPDQDTFNNTGAPTKITKVLTILSIEYNLHNPEKNTYSIGTPNTILSRTYGSAAKKTKSSSSAAGNPIGSTKKTLDEAKNSIDKVDETLWSHVINNYYNHDMYSELDSTQTKSILKSQYLFLKQANDRPKGAAGLLLDGWNGKIVFDADNPRDEKMALKKMEMYGDNFKYIRHIIEGENVISTVGFSANSDGLVGGSQVMLGQDAEGNKVAINLDGLGGLMSMFGIDGTSGEMFKSIDISGFQNFLKFFKAPETPQEKEAGQGKETGEIDGENGSQKIGKDANNQWLIQMNEPITYVDSEGHTKTVPAGTVSAKDFNLVEVPSFKTELAVINTALIGVAHIRDLTAINAFIQNLQSETATIDLINAKTSRALTFRGDEYILNVTGSQQNPGGTSYLGDCLKTCTIAKGQGVAAENDDANKYYLKFTNARNVALTNIELPIDDSLADIKAYVNKIKSSTSYGDAKIYAQSVYGDEVRGNDVKIYNGGATPSGAYSIKTDFVKNAWFETGTGDDAGKIILHLSNSAGGDIGTPNFNIADTQFYKNAVSAARPSSGATVSVAENMYHWYFNITCGDGTVKRLDIDCSAIYTAVRNAVNLSDFSFSTFTTDTPNTNQNTISISTTGRGANNNVTKSVNVYLDSGAWSSDSTTRDIILKTVASGTTYNLAKTSVDASTIYNRAVPSSGTASSRKNSTYTWIFTITKADGTTKNIEIDCSSIYSDARSGYYTQSQYNSYGTSRYNAGWNVGGATAYASADKALLAPGETSTVTVYYKDYNGNAVNTGRTSKITAQADAHTFSAKTGTQSDASGTTTFYASNDGVSGYSSFTINNIWMWTSTSQPHKASNHSQLATKWDVGDGYYYYFNTSNNGYAMGDQCWYGVPHSGGETHSRIGGSSATWYYTKKVNTSSGYYTHTFTFETRSSSISGCTDGNNYALYK